MTTRTALKILIAVLVVCIAAVAATATWLTVADRSERADGAGPTAMAESGPGIGDVGEADADAGAGTSAEGGASAVDEEFVDITEYTRADVERLAVAVPDEVLGAPFSRVGMNLDGGAEAVLNIDGWHMAGNGVQWPVNGIDAHVVYFRSVNGFERGTGDPDFNDFPFARPRYGLEPGSLLDLGPGNGHLYHDGTTVFHVTGQDTNTTTVTALSPLAGFREFQM